MEKFERLLEKVRTIPVAVVVGTVIQVYNGDISSPVAEKDLPALRSGNYLALCPFHLDEELGSFVITPDKQLWYCFAERIGGDGIKFEMKKFSLSFKNAVYHLACRFGMIGKREYKAKTGQEFGEDIKDVEIPEESTAKRQAAPSRTAPDDVVQTAYSLMPKVCRLKKEHERHLLKERGLTREDLGDYFSFPTRKMDLPKHIFREAGEMMARKKFGKALRELDESEREWMNNSKALAKLAKELPFVPGFYMNEKDNRIDFYSYKGIGFLVRDDLGKILGIQIRKDTVKKGESRYVWFSSRDASTRQGCSAGSSPGAPGGVLFPKGGTGNAQICITEGRFKAEQIAKKGNIAVYVSGVGNWMPVMPMVDRIREGRTKAYIMFDADMMGNTAVHAPMKEMGEYLRDHGLRPYVLLWPIEKGKGFDDLVLQQGSTYHRYMKDMSFRQFESLYESVLKETLSEFSVEKVQEISEEKARHELKKTLQDALQKAIFT